MMLLTDVGLMPLPAQSAAPLLRSRLGHIMAAVFAVFAVIALHSTAQAGEWTRLSDEQQANQCNSRFDGEIKRGDLTRGWQEGMLNAHNARVCLNSPGGSLKEVLDFLKEAERREQSFATVVRSTDQCLSACAILFMFGKSWGANSPFPDRTLEPGARLGFHSPFLPQSILEQAKGSELYDAAIAVSKLLVDRSYKSETVQGPALPQELLSIILGTPADTMYYIKTLGEMKILNINASSGILDGRVPYLVEDTSEIGLKKITGRICSSTYVFTFRSHFVTDQYRYADLVKSVETLRDFNYHFSYDKDKGRFTAVLTGPFYEPGWYSAGAIMYCRATLQISEVGSQVHITSFNVQLGNFNTVDHDIAKIPEYDEAFSEVESGLWPIETEYR